MPLKAFFKVHHSLKCLLRIDKHSHDIIWHAQRVKWQGWLLSLAQNRNNFMCYIVDKKNSRQLVLRETWYRSHMKNLNWTFCGEKEKKEKYFKLNNCYHNFDRQWMEKVSPQIVYVHLMFVERKREKKKIN